MKYWILVLLLAFIVPLANAAKDSDFANLEVRIVPRPHKDVSGYPIGSSDSYYFVKSASRIFFQDKTIVGRISSADISSDQAEFTIGDSKYGEGTLRIFSDKNLKKVPAEELKQVINNSLSDDKVSLVVVDPVSKTYHLATSNHLPPANASTYMTKAAADAGGNKECGVCFYDELYLPDYETEMAIQKKGAAELRHYNERLTDPGLQVRVDRIGHRVLAGWPYPLLGYTYKFGVLESREINAFSLAAGSIFVTTGLLKTAQSDDELEAVLAHEIAHVERRHALQSYKAMVSSQQAQMALQVLGGMAAGIASANGRSGTAAAIGGVTLASMIAIKVQQEGYSKEQEKEADEFAVRYFSKSGKSFEPLRLIFKKLMYHNLCSRLVPDPVSNTHPALGSRLNSLTGSTTNFTTAQYHLVYKEKPLEIRILSSSTSEEGSELALYVSDFSTLHELLGGSDVIRFNSGTKSYEFEIITPIGVDPWGGVVTTARGAVPLSEFPEFDSIGGTVYVDFNTGKIADDSHRNAYPDLRLYKLAKGSYY